MIGLVIASYIRDPYLLRFRQIAVWLLVLWSLVGVGLLVGSYKKRAALPHRQRIERMGFAAVLVVLMLILARSEVGHARKKHQILHTDKQRLHAVGQHCIAGYRHADDIVPLIQSGGVGGVYVSHRNVKERTLVEVRAEIVMFQDIRRAAGLPPLFIVGDQEGGIVSHLSPPLTRLPALAMLVDEPLASTSTPDSAIDAYADIHAQGLKSLGVNVNLSPVVDLKVEPQRAFRDRHSRIIERAISDDPSQVAHVALLYSQRLQQSGIIPTLKHFPGLGRVTGDTHHVSASLDSSIADLQRLDWVPFRQVLKQSQAFLMLGHVLLPALDSQYPVSCSKRVIQAIIRNQWQHDGVLLTDDFSMRPIYSRPGGVGGSAVAALNAGVDLVLISYDGEQIYEILHALLRASTQQKLDRGMLQRSQQRLEKVLQQIQAQMAVADIR